MAEVISVQGFVRKMLWTCTTEGFKLLIPKNLIAGKHGDKDGKEKNSTK